MKYVVILGDGMADYRIPELGNKTPLEAANKPAMDRIAGAGKMGLVKTIPDGMPAGSDTANLSVFGYDPNVYYSGRASLEAISMGIDLKPTDAVYRANFVSLDHDSIEKSKMADYCAGEIESAEAAKLISFLNEKMCPDPKASGFRFFPGRSYRNCFIRYNAEIGADLTPPHDISGKPVRDYLPKGNNGEILLGIMREAHNLLKTGNSPANGIWLWGESRKPLLPNFTDKYGVKGSVISAVDLIEGIGLSAGLGVIRADGATGNYKTNYASKANAAINALKSGGDFVYIHIEAPDECGHRNEIREKVYAIEKIDSDILSPVLDYLESSGEDFALLLTPDHPTPIALRTHTRDAVPFVIYRKGDKARDNGLRYTERSAKETGVYIERGHKLMDEFFYA